jgi:hypothetical protein
MSKSTSNRDFSKSSDSTLLSEGITRALTYLQLTDSKRSERRSDDETASQLLKRQFSTKSAISAISSFASRMQRSANRSSSEQREDLRIIGLGSCGTIFEIPGTEFVFKKGTNGASLWQDFSLTNQVHHEPKMSAPSCKESFRPPPSLKSRFAMNFTRPVTNSSGLRI